ncbi:DUF192 domain-containing protein [Halorussus pelagicus]|uniref:DUF192 domain-containing protein n=1 Tax=Halorussus pelagicus TaxID=2505977 RepID=UPI000FFB4907|nr:DUF192 domain-containing protein [Halorussus pelagicus]
MDNRRAFWFGVGTLLVGGYVLFHAGLLPVPAGTDDRRSLRVTDCAGTEKVHLNAAVADSFAERYVGLSRTESLAPGEGLLLAYDENGSKGIAMRNMDFPLGVVFVSVDGEVTGIKTLDAADSPLSYHLLYETMSESGRYVVETNAGWAAERGVSVGDCVRWLSWSSRGT